MSDRDFVIGLIKPNQMFVDREQYQRFGKRSQIKAISDGFDELLLGVPLISRRSDGTLAVIDGQHRVMAAIECGRGDVPITCQVADGLSVAEEAQLFERINKNRRRVNANDLFRARLTAKDVVAVGMSEIMSRHGLTLGKRTQNAVRAIGACQQAFEDGTLDRVVQTIKSWGDGDSRFFEKILIDAISEFFLHHSEIEPIALALKLRAHSYSRVIMRIKHQVDSGAGNSRVCGLAVIREIYNERRKSRRLGAPSESPAAVQVIQSRLGI